MAIGWVSLLVIVVWLVVSVRKGTNSIAIAVAIAAITVVLSIAAIGTTAVTGTFYVLAASTIAVTAACPFVGAFAVAIASAFAFAVADAAAVIVAGVVAGTFTFALANAFALNVAISVVIPWASSVPVIFVNTYLGWRAVKGDPRDRWLRSWAIGFGTIGGTSFRHADLTDARFTQAQLQNTDLRWAIVHRTDWHQVKSLERAQLGGTTVSFD